MDSVPDSPLLAAADEGSVADYLNPDEVVRVARASGADGICPAPEPATLAVAEATERLGLPGVSPEAAALLGNKGAMREALEANGIANPEFRATQTVEEAEAAA